MELVVYILGQPEPYIPTARHTIYTHMTHSILIQMEMLSAFMDTQMIMVWAMFIFPTLLESVSDSVLVKRQHKIDRTDDGPVYFYQRIVNFILLFP